MSAVAIEEVRHLRAVTASAATPRADAAPEVRSGRRTLVLLLATASVIVAAVFGIVGLNALAANAAVEARALEREVGAAERRYAELVAAVAAKEDPARIRAEAFELGMVPSVAARHLVLSRTLDADGRRAAEAERVVADPLKPVLTQER